MGTEWHTGRKAIIAFLRPYLGLSDDTRTAWNMVRRWRSRYWQGDAVIQTLPNGKPSLDPEAFQLWWTRYKQHYSELRRESMSL